MSTQKELDKLLSEPVYTYTATFEDILHYADEEVQNKFNGLSVTQKIKTILKNQHSARKGYEFGMGEAGSISSQTIASDLQPLNTKEIQEDFDKNPQNYEKQLDEFNDLINSDATFHYDADEFIEWYIDNFIL